MKITKSQLKQIIKEELSKALGEDLDVLQLTPEQEKSLSEKVFNYLVRLPLNDVYRGTQDALNDLRDRAGFENVDRAQLLNKIFSMVEDYDPQFRKQYELQAQKSRGI